MNYQTEKHIMISLSTVAISLAIGLLLINCVHAQTNIEGLNPDINEDQIITCVKDVSNSDTRGQLICHVFDIDDLDWYQELSEDNYGQLGSTDDSFGMGLVD